MEQEDALGGCHLFQVLGHSIQGISVRGNKRGGQCKMDRGCEDNAC
jgi:hypothetical protein